MAPAEPVSLRDCLAASARSSKPTFWGAGESAAYFDLLRGSSLGGRLAELAGRSVLVATGSQLTTALTLIELDGIARRITLCPTDLSAEHFPAVAAGADADGIVYDGGSVERAALNLPARVICSGTITPSDLAPVDRI